jgi:hypothetical protein
MRGDQLVRIWRVSGGIEARPNGLTMADIARPGKIGDPTEEKPFKSLFQKLGWAFLFLGIEANSFSATFLLSEPDRHGE